MLVATPGISYRLIGPLLADSCLSGWRPAASVVGVTRGRGQVLHFAQSTRLDPHTWPTPDL